VFCYFLLHTMKNQIISSVLVFVVLSVCIAHREEEHEHEHEGGRALSSSPYSKLCQSVQANQTQASVFYNQGLQLLATYQLNSSYVPLFSLHSQTLTYVRTLANQQLFLTNCAAFIAGLEQAVYNDQKAQQQLQTNVEQQFTQLVASSFGLVLRL